jgi:glycine/D-amino acid oxidase-like deaminating enzyme
MKVIVVGAGIAGCSVVRACWAKGYAVTHITDGQAAGSLAATAILRRGYHVKDRRDVQLWDRSIELYRQWKVQMREGALVTSYRNPNLKLDKDWRMLDPAEPLIEVAALAIKGIAVSADGRKVTLRNGKEFTGDKVVMAIGSSTGKGKITHGVTWVAHKSALNEYTLRVHHMAPYKTLTAGVVGGSARLGSSSATTAEAAREQAHKMLRLAEELGIAVKNGWTPVYGQRIQTEPRAFQHPDGHYVLTGYHRTGYALAPAEAEEMVDSW